MIEFWLAVGLLLLVGTAFLLVPVLRGRRAQAEEDRTALNVALYQERLAELTAQREAGTLTAEQFDAGQAEVRALDQQIQRAEFLVTKGAVDMIVDRRELRDTVASTLAMLQRLPADAVVQD